MVCKKCFSDKYIKNGIVRGKQRYKCRCCGYNFVCGDTRQKITTEGKALSILLYASGKASYEFIAKQLEVSPVAVMNLVKRETIGLPKSKILSSIKKVDFDKILNFINKNYECSGLWSAFELSSSVVSGLILLRHADEQ